VTPLMAIGMAVYILLRPEKVDKIIENLYSVLPNYKRTLNERGYGFKSRPIFWRSFAIIIIVIYGRIMIKVLF